VNYHQDLAPEVVRDGGADAGGKPRPFGTLNRELVGKAEAIESPRRVLLDMDSTEIPVHGEQEQST
jgi:hypothetical protein